jgi:hypothetical protein
MPSTTSAVSLPSVPTECRQGAGHRTEPGDRDEDRDGQHDLREGPDRVEHLPHDVRDEPARDVARAEEAERQRQRGADDCPDPRDLERLDHVGKGFAEVRPLDTLGEEHLPEDAGDARGQVGDPLDVDPDGHRRPEDDERHRE